MDKSKNPHIEAMKEDVLYHIGLSSGSQDLKAMFGDVKVIYWRIDRFQLGNFRSTCFAPESRVFTNPIQTIYRQPHWLHLTGKFTRKTVCFCQRGFPALACTLIFFQFVCMGGTPHRMETFANYIMKEIGYQIPSGTALVDISKHSHRYNQIRLGWFFFHAQFFQICHV